MGMEVADIGVKTRAQVLAMAKRKKCDDQSELASSTIVKLKRRRRLKKKENSAHCAMSQDSSHVLGACCCSSNCSASELEHDQNLGSINLVHMVEDENENVEEAETSTFSLDNRDRKEITNTSEPRVDSSSVKPESSDPDPSPVREPPAGELEEFFATAENNLQKQFTEKYNYDFTKDVPLEGRYEWVVNLS